MAYTRYPYRPAPGERKISMEEFKNKVMKKYDSNNDGRISVEELRQAIRDNGGWFSTAKANRLVQSVDTNGNGFIDLNENELSKLVVFAMKELDCKVVCL